jgi:hypothetical protein
VTVIYLKRTKLHSGFHYILSETYSDEGVLKARDLMDLGKTPGDYILYPGGNGFYIDSIIEDTLRAKGVHFTSDDLEHIFRPYLPPRLQEILDRFEHRKPRTDTKCNMEGIVPEGGKVHIFDARRLYYLRFARIDSGELEGRHWKFLNVFLCKSRDEIESMVDSMEDMLSPGEYATYVYASFGLSLSFPPYLREHPSALDQIKLDEYFTEALCRLDADEGFFSGVERDERDGLHPYLTKYAWLYFDHEFLAPTWNEGFRFAGGFTGQTAQPPGITTERAYELLGITGNQFARMSKKELTRLYRRRAKKVHPDRGGSHKDFLRLSEAYEKLNLQKTESGNQERD